VFEICQKKSATGSDSNAPNRTFTSPALNKIAGNRKMKPNKLFYNN